ncbi:MAG: ABC transporter ATP-binding protein/permease [Parasporobacterium sp.]|nr:ABC transporter ATP-binding protein/permease [Parasporobacterium sp.]
MLQLIDISKQYKTGELVQQALDGVSFCLRDSEFVSVLGPSGSGKTTLLNIIGGLDRYDSGDLIINGVSTKQYKNKEWDTYRNHTIGFVFQSYNLIPHQSILANVELALTIGGMSVRERRKKAKQALENVGLGDQIHKKPNQMSGGQMQRVAIARALVNDPDILLADEPTGALDSETSLQIMELLKEVAADRLVVMVTHNAELAEQYSNRIIKLRDGKIISDSHPYEPGAETASDAGSVETKDVSAGGREKTAVGKKKKNASMSFLTSLALSANNLRSKMGRTILISLASSIGIIGIALILAISTGVNDYIYNIQKDTMSSYPITISSRTIDLNGLMNEGTSMREQFMDMLLSGNEDDGQVHSDYSTMEASEMFSTSMVYNNLTDFKAYLDDPSSEIHRYLGENGIAYTYNVAFDVYVRDSSGNLRNTNASVNDIIESGNRFTAMTSGLSFMRTNMFAWQRGGFSSAANFSEITKGGSGEPVSRVIKDNYELVAGSWPETADEVLIVLTRSNTLPAETLYQLGIMEGQEYTAALEKIEKGEKVEDAGWDYDDILGRTFYLITASDHYVENEDGTFSYLDDSVMNQQMLMENAMELKVCGIIRPSDDANTMDITTAVAYTSGVTDYCIEHTSESSVIKAQKAAPEVNVLTGMKFAAGSEEQKAEDAKIYLHDLTSTEKAQLYTLIRYFEIEEYSTGTTEETETEGSDKTGLQEDLSDLKERDGDSLGLSQGLFGGDNESASSGLSSGDTTMDSSSLEELMTQIGLDKDSLSSMMRLLGMGDLDSILADISTIITDETAQAALFDRWLEDDPDQEILVALYDQYVMGGSYDDNMSSFGMVSYDAPSSISIYTDTFENKDAVTACIDDYNLRSDSDHRIVYTDYIALLTSSVTQIVNAISYVLIAFVAISLLVSCIMIGIITHISVLERTKEIGILRALGASRGNISHVFNAETVIIGLISGILGILIAWLLTIPINLILKVLLGSSMVNVHLPILYALLLICISIAVTVIGGLIPAAKASKKDPVVALRTE